ncbi:aldo/keto reductase [Microbacterium sp. CFH 90308]|uniref:Aldo/keto reductase n=1 Tax=Microbacterium salsuginis TaxID=2722803 RepID=A0ABX1KCM7_9MICO|nr:aldo/keto reductase [Microbacterium sp. CFH 90308]NLP83166.1 aldo/keto reductase [Microbacterium sp. CFH 90308]
MQYRPLGRTGIRISPFALGAMMFSSFGNGDQEEVNRMVSRALDAGINLIDTADAYGDSEEMLGRALKGRRDDIVLASKFARPIGDEVNHQGGSRRWIVAAVENSLRRLQTDHLDLYQMHRPDPETDIEETLSALTDLVRSGKVRAIGSSDMPASEIVEAQWVSERRGLERFRTEQPHYSLLDRTIEREVLPVAQRYGMGTVIWSPLASGMLTGRIRRGQETDLRRTRMFAALRDERRIDAVEELIPLAEEAGMSLTHMALAFVIAHPGVTAALIGPRTMEQLEDLLAAAEITLSDEVLDRIDAIVPPGTGVGRMDQEYNTPPILSAALRRRPAQDRAAA